MNDPLSVEHVQRQYRAEIYPEMLLGFIKILLFTAISLLPFFWWSWSPQGSEACGWDWAGFHCVELSYELWQGRLWLGTWVFLECSTPQFSTKLVMGWKSTVLMSLSGRTSSPIVSLKLGSWGSWEDLGGSAAMCLIGTRHCSDRHSLSPAYLLSGMGTWELMKKRSPHGHHCPPAPLHLFAGSN